MYVLGVSSKLYDLLCYGRDIVPYRTGEFIVRALCVHMRLHSQVQTDQIRSDQQVQTHQIS